MRKPTGPKHAKCQHHEPSALGLLCFADDLPTDETVIDRLYWADELAAILSAHQAAWQARPEPDGMVLAECAYGSDGELLRVERNSMNHQSVAYRADGSIEPMPTWHTVRVPIVPDGLGSHDVARYRSTFTGGAA